MTYSGKYWYLDLKDRLYRGGIYSIKGQPMLLLYPDGSFVKLIVYVDDKLFFGNNEATLQEFKDKLAKRFDVEFKDRPTGTYQLGCRICSQCGGLL